MLQDKMTKKDKQRDLCLARLADYVLKAGLGETSLRQLAAAAEISDRMLLYYFKNKSEIMTLTLLRAAEEMTETLEKVLPANQPLPAKQLLAEGAALTQSDDFAPFMRLSLEIAVRAGRGEAPYTEVARLIITGFQDWIMQRLETQDPSRKRAQALMILAIIDGFGVLCVGIEKSSFQDGLEAFLDEAESLF